MNAKDSIFVFAGETSADLYSGMLLCELKKNLPTTHFWGVGGPCSRGLIECILPMEAFRVMGFSDVVKALPRLTINFFKIKHAILKRRPKMVILIDQPSFCIKLAKSLRKSGYSGKIVQFVAPTVWAWKPKRAFEMAKHFDMLLTLFDFEPRYFAETCLKTVFVGHPIVELIAKDSSHILSLDPARPVLSIFPGSRLGEVKRNLPKQLEAASLFCKKHPQMQIAVSTTALEQDMLPQNAILVPFEARYELMKRSHIALAKSGTVNLELALHEVPTVVTYELSPLNHFMAKHIFKIDLPYYSIVNILCSKEVFFERIRPPVTSHDIAHALDLLQNDYARCKQECLALKSHVQSDVAPIQKCAREICELL